MLNPKHETFVVYVTSLSITSLSSIILDAINPFHRPQIASLIAKKALTKVFAKYSDFADVFSPNLASKHSKHTGINNYAIKLVNSQPPPYGPIYSLKPVELETLKAYIETNLANGFIKLSKSPIKISILFDRKLDGFLQLCVNYKSLNNLTIKNWYLLLLIGKLLDRSENAK